MKLWKPGKNKEEGDEVLAQQQNQNVKQKMDDGDGKQSSETADDSLRASDTAEKTEANDTAEGTGAQATEENEDKYPKGWTLTLLFTALCLGVFLTSLDNSILATAIPKITDNFHSLNDVSWYASAYLLTSCAFQPTLGRVYSVFSVKWTFLISLAVFEIGSAICGAAPSSLALIVGRAVAGCGSSGIFSGGLTILGFSVPLRKRPIFVGIFSAMFGLASVLGPILGGAFTDSYLTWRWCFYINLPLGGVALLLIIFFFKPPVREAEKLSFKEKMKRMDFIGASLLVPGVVCLLLALQWGGTKFLWRSPQIIGLLCGFAGIILIFIAVQFYVGEKATLPIRLLRQRTVACASIYVFFVGFALFILVFFLPIYFQSVQGSSAIKSAYQNLALLLGVTVMTILSGVGATLLGYTVPFMVFGSVLFTIGCGLVHTLTVGSPTREWIGYQLLAAFGAGFGLTLPVIAVQSVVPTEDIPVGSALVAFSQLLGGALSVAIAQNVFFNSLTSNLLPLGISAAQLQAAGASNLAKSVPAHLLPAVLQQYANALQATFIVPIAGAAAAFLVSFGIEWVNIKGKKMDMTAAA